MAKLVEKLHEVTQASSGGLGFLSPSRGPQRKARPAALLAMGGHDDAAALQSAAEAGADAVIISGWTPSSAGFASLRESLSGRNALWGVALERDYSPGALKEDQEQGAGFAVLGSEMSAAALFEEVEKFDLVVTVEPPRDDLALLSLRAVNLLPAAAALVDARFTPSGLARLSIADFARLRMVWESLRFPTLVTLKGAPEPADVRTLVQLGADGLVLLAEGVSASKFGEQIKGLIAALEETPAKRESEGAPLLAGLLGVSSPTPAVPGPAPSPTPRPRPGRPEPEEPDEP
jgi:hypothetical protein